MGRYLLGLSVSWLFGSNLVCPVVSQLGVESSPSLILLKAVTYLGRRESNCLSQKLGILSSPGDLKLVTSFNFFFMLARSIMNVGISGLSLFSFTIVSIHSFSNL